MIPKPKTPRDPKYIRWVKTLPCLVCRREPAGDSHHTETGGTGLTGSDYSVVPLCREHHSEIHAKGSKRGPWGEDQLKGILHTIRADYEQSCTHSKG